MLMAGRGPLPSGISGFNITQTTRQPSTSLAVLPPDRDFLVRLDHDKSGTFEEHLK